MYRRGQSFRIYVLGGANDGELIYESNSWDLPLVKPFTPPLRLQIGQRIRYETTYYNESTFPVVFGHTSEDEMCIVLGYYGSAQ